MRSARPLFFPNKRNDRFRRGMSLVIVLAMLVLVTMATMAFFIRATSNRTTENLRVNQALTSQLAASASDYVISHFLADLQNGAVKQGPVPSLPFYNVTSPIGVLPPTRVSPAASSLITSRFPTLVRQSVAVAPSNIGDANASSHSTTTSSQNARTIPPRRWNETRLNLGAGFDSADQVPNWIYFNRQGEAVPTPSQDVIGRIAYNVYNLSGLLDANIAGHPGLTGTELMVLKSGQPGADLTALPGVTSAAINKLAQFRMADAATGAAFKDATLEHGRAGFLSAKPEVSTPPRTFLASRSDLIRYATQENPDLASALPFLTHFSVASSTPGVPVDANDDNSPDVEPPFRQAATTLTRYYDDGTSYEQPIQAGEPLLDQRFSLARLSWLTPTGPAAGISPAAIQSCFGLSWNSSEKRWDYVGPTGSAVQDRLATLAQIATQNRDPNFFELLYAGIGRDSMDLALGRAIRYPGNLASGNIIQNNLSAYTGAFGFAYDNAAYQQAMRIGACIIDQVDSDNTPTVIRFDGEDTYGMEDLPLVSGIFLRPLYTPTPSNTTFANPRTAMWLVPQLWNPHRQSTAPTPTIRLVFESGDINWRFATTVSGQRLRTADVNFSVGGEKVQINPTAVESLYRASPNVTRTHSGVSAFDGAEVVSHPDWPAQEFIGLKVGEYDGEAGQWAFRTPAQWNQVPLPAPLALSGSPGEFTNNVSWGIEINNLKVALQVQMPGGQWQTYQIWGGPGGILSPSLSPTLWNDGIVLDDILKRPVNHWGEPYLLRAIRSLDPRTSRFGFAYTEHLPPPSNAPASTEQMSIPLIHQRSLFENRNREIKTLGGWDYQTPLIMANPADFWGGSPNWWGHVPLGRLWMSGRTGANNNSDPDISYADRDGVRRPADGYLAAWDANPMFIQGTGAANSFTASDRTRPVILQRPFRSVAELGYVFRDQPWKTLDFFSSSSADSALLDLFCVNETKGDLTAGKVNPRSAPVEVISALLRQSPYDEIFARNPGATGALVSSGEATAIAGTFSSAANTLLNPSGLPALVGNNTLTTAVTLAKPSREAPLRSLASVSDFSTWRLFGDIIVQTGRFATTDSSAGRFIVEGEERVWLDFAIDRHTGKVVYRNNEIHH